MWQMRRDQVPAASLVRTHPHFATGGAEVKSDRVEIVGAKRLPLDCEPRMLTRETAVLSLPRSARVTRPVNRRAPIGTGARPHRGRVHRKYPRSVGISRMYDDSKSDVSDLLRHVVADSNPIVARPIDTIDAAMILLVEPVRIRR